MFNLLFMVLKISKKKLSVLLFFAFLLGVQPLFSQMNFIRVNQVGYYAHSTKQAILANMEAEDFEIREYVSGDVVFRGELQEGKHWKQSNETLQVADFSTLTKPGKYYVYCLNEKSHPFEIKEKAVYESLSIWTLKAFYMWRASIDIKPEYATFNGDDYSRAMGHADDTVYIHPTAASENRPTETFISAPRGWYDAGDYNLYVVNAGISFHALALAYEMYPEYYKSLNLNIPESENGVPDLLDEMKWELDWLFNMQDEDGGVYHKLSSLRFCSMMLPSEDKLDRYMIGKSTAATLNFSAVMAMASRIYKDYDSIFPGLSDKALKASVSAWRWAEKNPEVHYSNPEGVRTGEYGDRGRSFSDEFFWAASELFITTGDKKYFERLDFMQLFETPTWAEVNSLGLVSLALHKEEMSKIVNMDAVDRKFKGLCEGLYNMCHYCPNLVPIKKFEWGSNGVIATNGAILGLAYYIYKSDKYKEAMLSTFNYLLGTNPTDYCFVSRFGSRYPKNFHDRRTTAWNRKEPMPGYLAGGSNANQVADCGKQNYPSSAPARCYLDKTCSYSTNEIAINWNAPMAALVGIVENQIGQ